MINKPESTVSESTAVCFIPRHYSWECRHEHERRKYMLHLLVKHVK